MLRSNILDWSTSERDGMILEDGYGSCNRMVIKQQGGDLE